jgi:hypothetical protein
MFTVNSHKQRRRLVVIDFKPLLIPVQKICNVIGQASNFPILSDCMNKPKNARGILILVTNVRKEA